ncbi:MAG: hypothetical protein KBA61_10870 [Spirochaetes bacterium]|mgnify:CR=1 FL=1|nr:hypothetical protein [Spirochaetota bacterium]
MAISNIEDAVRFIGQELRDNPGASVVKLIEEASQKYDLNPMQQEFLTNKYILNK